MELTLAQKRTLKVYIVANLNELPTDQHKADALNALASPDYRIFRDSVLWDTIMQNGMNWTRVDNLSVGKARIWEWMFDNTERAFNPAKPNIRTGINSVWVGTQADLDVRDAVYSHCHRSATVAEKLLVTSGSGTAPANDGDGSGPGVPGWLGTITVDDVINALSS